MVEGGRTGGGGGESAGKYSGTGTQRAPVVGSHLWAAVIERERQRESES